MSQEGHRGVWALLDSSKKLLGSSWREFDPRLQDKPKQPPDFEAHTRAYKSELLIALPRCTLNLLSSFNSLLASAREHSSLLIMARIKIPFQLNSSVSGKVISPKTNIIGRQTTYLITFNIFQTISFA